MPAETMADVIDRLTLQSLARLGGAVPAGDPETLASMERLAEAGLATPADVRVVKTARWYRLTDAGRAAARGQKEGS